MQFTLTDSKSTVLTKLNTNLLLYFDAVIDVDGDGDYTDIETCMDAYPSGGRFFVKNGTYPLTSANIVHIPPNTEIVGESRDGVVVTIATNIVAFQNLTNPCSNITVRNITVNGANLPESGSGEGKAMKFTGVTNLTIENCRSYHIMDLSFDIRDCVDVKLFRNESDTDSGMGFYIENTTHARVMYNYVHNLRLLTNTIPSAFIFYGCGASPDYDSNNIFAFNTVEDVGYSGISCELSPHTVIMGNSFNNTEDWAIWVTQSPHCTIVGNNTYDCGSTEGGDCGLKASHNSTVSGNTFDASWRESIYLGDCDFCNINGNQITDSGNWTADATRFPAIKLGTSTFGTGSSGNSICNNMIVSSVGVKPTYGIQEMDSACDYNHYVGNNIRGCTSNAITLLGSNSTKTSINLEP